RRRGCGDTASAGTLRTGRWPGRAPRATRHRESRSPSTEHTPPVLPCGVARSRVDHSRRAWPAFDQASPLAPEFRAVRPGVLRARRCRRRQAALPSHPVLAQLVQDPGHRTITLRLLRLQRRPATHTLNRPGNGQGRGRGIKRDDATDGDSTVGQYERATFAYLAKNASRFVAQLALREALELRLTHAHSPIVASVLQVAHYTRIT